LGNHAKAFNVFTGAGLGVVLVGLMIYRFVDMIWKSCKSKTA
jgi:hypothetical protein